ncbi:ribbon-helix-helix domain-containing protein [Clostridia bacterium OttesenSCG-928-O13]|nr:ribbon-helix-helix domain-containing protein [Clostridia bacterium OttesenSCG-928-O13]
MSDKFVVQPRERAFGKTTVVSARLPDDMVKRLDDVAKETGRSRNEVMVMAVDYALANLEIPKENQ